MQLQKVWIGEKLVDDLGNTSGVLGNNLNGLEMLLGIDGFGHVETKSITPEARPGHRPPVTYQTSPWRLNNADGLYNPGADEFARQLGSLVVPWNKALRISVAGQNKEEIVYCVEKLESRADAISVNVNCPNVGKDRLAVGQNPDLVREIVEAVRKVTRKPIFFKLSPVGDVAYIAQVAYAAGADGFIATNTIPGGTATLPDGRHILTNIVGGMSGAELYPRALECVGLVHSVLPDDATILAAGGAYNARTISSFLAAGAKGVCIGTYLSGLDGRDGIQEWVNVVRADMRDGTDNASALFKPVNSEYHLATITEVSGKASDFKVLRTDQKIDAKSGQFVEVFIPGETERPFSVLDDDRFTIAVQTRGDFSGKLNSLKPGSQFYFRGPYGRALDVPQEASVVLVGGGSGSAGLYLMAKEFSKNRRARVTCLFGARDIDHIPYLDKFRQFARVYIATEDGSYRGSNGIKGNVTDLFDGPIKIRFPEGSLFYNCGPDAMLETAHRYELQLTGGRRENIVSSRERMMRCGGYMLCGSCIDDQGNITCREPFISLGKLNKLYISLKNVDVWSRKRKVKKLKAKSQL